jgi:hypothetical protein
MSTSGVKALNTQSNGLMRRVEKVPLWGAVLPSNFESVDETLVVAQGQFDQRHY